MTTCNMNELTFQLPDYHRLEFVMLCKSSTIVKYASIFITNFGAKIQITNYISDFIRKHIMAKNQETSIKVKKFVKLSWHFRKVAKAAQIILQFDEKS